MKNKEHPVEGMYARWLKDPKGVEQENRDRLARLGPEAFLRDALGGRGVLFGPTHYFEGAEEEIPCGLSSERHEET